MAEAPSAPVAAERLLVGVAATLTVVFRDQLGEPVDATGAVTVDIVRGDGTTSVVTAGATTHAGTGTYTYALPAVANNQLDWLYATWKDGGTARVKTVHEVVGGFYFDVATMRSFDQQIANNTQRYTNALIQAKRTETERECERITQAAWTPRYRRIAITGTGTNRLLLPDRFIRTVRSLTAQDGSVWQPSDLSAIECKDSGEIVRKDGGIFSRGYSIGIYDTAWDSLGTENLTIEYEHGQDRPPEDLRLATMARTKYRLLHGFVVDLENTTLWQVPGVGQLSTPPADPLSVDDLEQRDVMRVYRRWSQAIPGIG